MNRTPNPAQSFHVKRPQLWLPGTRFIFRMSPDGTIRSAVRIPVQITPGGNGSLASA